MLIQCKKNVPVKFLRDFQTAIFGRNLTYNAGHALGGTRYLRLKHGVIELYKNHSGTSSVIDHCANGIGSDLMYKCLPKTMVLHQSTLFKLSPLS